MVTKQITIKPIINNQTLQKAIAVVGPTAVGKTSLAIQISQRLDGEIVSCDSVQVFKELNIGSAKPTSDELESARHHLIDVYSPIFQPDVGSYKQLAEAAIQDIISRNKLPIITGGTGMYFNSLYYGLFEGPSRDDKIRCELELLADSEGLKPLYDELEKVDPVTFKRLLPNDTRRLIRALEVYRITGIPLSQLREHNTKLPIDWLVIGLNIDRKVLYDRINRRVDLMLENGLEKETKGIIEQYGVDAFALGSIGYRHCVNYLNGKWSYGEMVETLKRDTRRYAKRQLTWFRKVEGIQWFQPSQKVQIDKAIEDFTRSEIR